MSNSKDVAQEAAKSSRASISEFSVKRFVSPGGIAREGADCLVVGVFSDGPQSEAVRALDRATRGVIGRHLARGDLPAEPGATLMLHNLMGISAPRALLVSLGAGAPLSERLLGTVVTAAWKCVCRASITQVVWALVPTGVWPAGDADIVRRTVIALRSLAYRFDGYACISPPAPPAPARIIFALTDGVAAAAIDAVREGVAIADGMALARDLGNAAANVCTPAYLADRAKALRLLPNVDVQILSHSEMARLGMGGILAVARGSSQLPKFIVVHYRGKPISPPTRKRKRAGDGDAATAADDIVGESTRPVVLIGKGVTFDSGGISLKPGEAMDEMKFDMCGAAAVLGALHSAATLALPIDVIALVPAAENMPSGTAYKPGDVVTTLSGKTVEVLNTDAEGRLLLCDALTYAERFQPSAVVDVATLTGACVMTLGHHRSGLFSSNDVLAQALEKAGDATGDVVWRLPLDAPYDEMLKSSVADMTNLGGRLAGAITAACFLGRFATGFPWAHLDVAGTASKGGPEKGATGRPVPLLVAFLLSRCGDSLTPEPDRRSRRR
ncbi:leucyl aminopeptidase [Pandoraea bronchicola]|uniref:Probable cytosol aminopeptidase n=1 Tax=Pandoraea bronchicola TaxID=2508287 RepID=A0A5E5BRD9_9BURK|nr:leucyl aminopeptidase [Pandoraea bronchicola]VVE86860.1 cytosol aminopeptidase [Pandoraea bronchicola]